MRATYALLSSSRPTVPNSQGYKALYALRPSLIGIDSKAKTDFEWRRCVAKHIRRYEPSKGLFVLPRTAHHLSAR